MPTDLDAYTTAIFADPDVMRYLPPRDTPPRERAERAMNYFNERWVVDGFGPWALEYKENGELIGDCGLRRLEETGEVEVLYAIAKSYWDRGLTTEAARASVRYGFETLGLEKIIALAMPENFASRRVMEKCGFQYEKNVHYFDIDLMYYGLERQNYRKVTPDHDPRH